MSCREMSLKISMTLESYDEQHVWRIADVRCGLDKGLVCGLSGLMHVRLLLTQHFLAVAASFMLRCSLRRRSGHSKLTIWPYFKPGSHRNMVEFTRRGQSQ